MSANLDTQGAFLAARRPNYVNENDGGPYTGERQILIQKI
jgi:hypothetical protein